MPNTFFMSDPHTMHEKTITHFKRPDGSPLRDFLDAKAMTEHMIEQNNKVVRTNDRLICLGDVTMKKRDLHYMGLFNGHKILIMGNHDIFHATEYLNYFEDVMAYKVFSHLKMICSHIPIHPSSKGRFRMNMHGHLHANVVQSIDVLGKINEIADPTKKYTLEDFNRMAAKAKPEMEQDPFYYSVCMEQIDYTPIALDDIEKYMTRFLPPPTNEEEGEEM